MYARADLALYEPGGRPVALAEVKNKRGTSREWAAKTRRNLLALGGFGDVMRSVVSNEERGDDRDWLDRSGFRAAVEGGRIEYDAAARTSTSSRTSFSSVPRSRSKLA